MEWRVDYPTVPTGWPSEFVVVENRSDRVWIYGWVRMVPAILFFGGLVLMCLLGPYFVANPWIVGPGVLQILGVPVFLERSRLLDPVDFIAFGPSDVYVKRLAGRQASFATDITQIEFTKPADEDYDERQLSRRFVEVVLRFQRSRAYRLLASSNDAAKIAAWAAQHGRSVIEQTD